MKKQTVGLIAAVLALTIIPLLLHRGAGESGIFTGADDQAQERIAETHPSYRPWAKPLFEPPSGEIATLLFSLQAALGAGFIG